MINLRAQFLIDSTLCNVILEQLRQATEAYFVERTNKCCISIGYRMINVRYVCRVLTLPLVLVKAV